ncbi:hypothetical protein F2Q69_00061180 [Brassica cretica]|uniref:Uncharacterized protein n=1 Tax=Brassica cretica TaxID=69181 RepID=A0A8S9RLJ8_BRACR|nr:hypothetical protein F2Q69_00061180 [Brassica cretica]
MHGTSLEVTDENREAAQEAKGKAMEALSERNFDEAIEHPTSAIMYGNIASVYTKLKKPNAVLFEMQTLHWRYSETKVL